MSGKLFLFIIFVALLSLQLEASENDKKVEGKDKDTKPDIDTKESKIEGPTPCTCGVFLTGQFQKGSKEQPKGVPALTQELDEHFLNNFIGTRQCTTKCLETIIKHLPKSGDIICATIDRDCYKERAYLFVKNYNSTWVNSNMSAGREFCCKDNLPYKC